MAYPAPSLSSFDCALLTQILCRSSTARRWIGTKWWSRGCRADQSSDFYPATPDLCRVHFSRWIQDFGYLSGPIRYPKITQEDPRRVAHSAKDTVFEEGEDGFDRPFLMKDREPRGTMKGAWSVTSFSGVCWLLSSPDLRIKHVQCEHYLW